MNVRTLRIALLAFWLFAGALLMAESGQAQLPMMTTGAPFTAAGGNYVLTTLTWASCAASTDGSLVLQIPTSATLRGNGCCCTYLPVVTR
jgi:hypothetical protein